MISRKYLEISHVGNEEDLKLLDSKTLRKNDIEFELMIKSWQTKISESTEYFLLLKTASGLTELMIEIMDLEKVKLMLTSDVKDKVNRHRKKVSIS